MTVSRFAAAAATSADPATDPASDPKTPARDAASGVDARPAPSDALRWQWSRFDTMAPADLYAALALRQRVFVVEQQCVFVDADGADEQAFHLLGWQPGEGGTGRDVLVAYLRLVDPGVKFAEPSIGRVITAPEARGRGHGRALMQEGLAGAARRFPGRDLRIAAQQRLAAFYASLGFVTASTPYLEDGIPHVDMLRSA